VKLTGSNEKPRLFLFFSHVMTEAQASDARRILGVSDIFHLPTHLVNQWGSVDPSAESLESTAVPFKEWLSANARTGDLVLVQGDFGLTYIMVNYAFGMGCVPVYSTTERVAGEKQGEGGAVELTKTVRHVIYRRYER